MLIVGGAGIANAAPPYATEATVSNFDFTVDQVQGGSHAQLTAEWALPDDPTPPAGFVIALPPELEGRSDTFNITAQDTGETIATCKATARQLECDFDAEYLKANPKNLKGDVNFWVKVGDTVTEEETKTFTVGGEAVTIIVTPPGTSNCGDNCEFSWEYKKDGFVQYGDPLRVQWYVHVAAEKGGMEGGLNVEIIDVPDANQKLIIDGNVPLLQWTNQIGTDGSGAERPTGWSNVPADQYTVNPTTGAISFTSTAGYYYQAMYMSEILDGGAAGLYLNDATFNINGTKSGETTGQARYAGGGGSGIGENVGVFTITKAVEGSATGLPADLVFTGTYSVTTPDNQILSGDYSVLAGETWRSPEFPRDSTVSLTENAPTEPSNVTWGEPVFSSNDFTLVGGELTELTLTNTADVKLGQFSISKALTGTADALALVPADATFTVDYAYEAGVGFDAGSGSLVISADGSSVTSPELPAGAVVTLTEQTPAAVEGLEWGTPEISPATVTIGEGATAEVIVTNPVTESTGGFSLVKSVSGDGSGLVPSGTIFTVDYAWTTEDGRAGNGTVEVTADAEPVVVDGIPAGAVVTLTENAAAAIPGVDWLDPIFSENGFTIIAGNVVAIDLDNPAARQYGVFAITKVIAGSGKDLVPSDTEFAVTYSYPAGDGFEAGSGELVVKADGVAVESGLIPFGAYVTLEETAPDNLAGVTWVSGDFDFAEIHTEEGVVQAVTLTNTYETIPPTETPAPTPTPTATTPALPVTGADGASATWLFGAGILVAAGAALLIGTRRSARRS